jgi:hypothetical protein
VPSVWRFKAWNWHTAVFSELLAGRIHQEQENLSTHTAASHMVSYFHMNALIMAIQIMGRKLETADFYIS